MKKDQNENFDILFINLQKKIQGYKHIQGEILNILKKLQMEIGEELENDNNGKQ